MKDKHGMQSEALREAEDSLFEAIVSLRDPAECGNFFRDLCTPAELQALARSYFEWRRVQQPVGSRDVDRTVGGDRRGTANRSAYRDASASAFEAFPRVVNAVRARGRSIERCYVNVPVVCTKDDKRMVGYEVKSLYIDER